MHIFGFFLVCVLLGVGFSLMQAVFFFHTGRGVWRAMVPTSLRFAIFPKDNVRLDAFAVMEEWVAVLFCGAFLMLPVIALHALGLIRVFPY